MTPEMADKMSKHNNGNKAFILCEQLKMAQIPFSKKYYFFQKKIMENISMLAFRIIMSTMK